MKAFFRLKPPTTPAPHYTKPVKFAQGNFGEIYRAVEVPSKTEIAIKIERTQKTPCHTLKHEASMLKALKNTPGVPSLMHFSQESTYAILIMPLYGKDTKELFLNDLSFSHNETFAIIQATLGILERVHAKNIVHRDLKPANVVQERDGDGYVLIDYGLAAFYRTEGGKHIKQKSTQQYIGNMRFGSIASHFFQEMSRKDDLESLGYMLLFFLKGGLPWDNLEILDQKRKIMEIGKIKAAMDYQSYCKLEELPKEIADYFEAVRKLKFEEEPNYKFLKELLMNAELKMKKKEIETSKPKTMMICSSPDKIPSHHDFLKITSMFLSQEKRENDQIKEYNLDPGDDESIIFLCENYNAIHQKTMNLDNPFSKCLTRKFYNN